MLEDPIPELKRKLARSIVETIDHQWYRYEGLIGLDQPRISDLERGSLDHFSLQKLIRVLAILNRQVDIRVVAVAPVPSYGELKRERDRKRAQKSKGM